MRPCFSYGFGIRGLEEVYKPYQHCGDEQKNKTQIREDV